MAIARCEKHGHPKGKKGNVYLHDPLLPLGYPETGVICGTRGCDNSAKIWVTQREQGYYQQGDRVFGYANNASKVRVQ